MERKILLCLGVLLASFVFAKAQNVSGRILDTENGPIPGATLYVREVMRGSVADEEGAFQFYLSPGNYTCEVNSMGFERKVIRIEVKDEPVALVIILEEKVYLLPEVTIANSKEDPAYFIMRTPTPLSGCRRTCWRYSTRCSCSEPAR